MNGTGQTYRQMIRVLMTVFLIAGVVGVAMAGSEEEKLRQAAYKKIMENVLGEKSEFGVGRGASERNKPNPYREIKDRKALSVCIYWSGNSVADIRTSAWWYSFSRRGQMGELRRTALNNCRSVAKGKGRDCKCHIVDENDKNKLKLPEEWKARVLAFSHEASKDIRAEVPIPNAPKYGGGSVKIRAYSGKPVVIYGQRGPCGNNSAPSFGYAVRKAITKAPSHGILSDGGVGKRHSGRCNSIVPVRAVTYTSEPDFAGRDTVIFWDNEQINITVVGELTIISNRGKTAGKTGSNGDR